MKNSILSKLVIRVAVFYFTFAGFCQVVHAQSEIRFRLAHDTVIIVSLMANEQGPFDFILDTGTTTTVVDTSIARQLSLVPLNQSRLNTVGGSQTLTRSSMRTLSAGTVHAENLEVLIQDLAELRKVDKHIEGILAQNFLSRFNYLLDYRRRLVRIELASEIQDAIEGEPVSMELNGNKMIVASEVRSPSRVRLRLLLDSGTNVVVLIRGPFQAANPLAPERWLEAKTGSGHAGTEIGRIHTLTVGTQQFRDIAVALPRADPAAEERLEDGLLPMAIFSALYVNNRDGYVVFDPQTKKK